MAAYLVVNPRTGKDQFVYDNTEDAYGVAKNQSGRRVNGEREVYELKADGSRHLMARFREGKLVEENPTGLEWALIALAVGGLGAAGYFAYTAHQTAQVNSQAAALGLPQVGAPTSLSLPTGGTVSVTTNANGTVTLSGPGINTTLPIAQVQSTLQQLGVTLPASSTSAGTSGPPAGVGPALYAQAPSAYGATRPAPPANPVAAIRGTPQFAPQFHVTAAQAAMMASRAQERPAPPRRFLTGLPQMNPQLG